MKEVIIDSVRSIGFVNIVILISLSLCQALIAASDKYRENIEGWSKFDSNSLNEIIMGFIGFNFVLYIFTSTQVSSYIEVNNGSIFASIIYYYKIGVILGFCVSSVAFFYDIKLISKNLERYRIFEDNLHSLYLMCRSKKICYFHDDEVDIRNEERVYFPLPKGSAFMIILPYFSFMGILLLFFLYLKFVGQSFNKDNSPLEQIIKSLSSDGYMNEEKTREELQTFVASGYSGVFTEKAKKIINK